MNIIDLSVPCSNNTENVNIILQDNLPLYLGYECYAYDLEIKSHTGTYFESSAHLFREGKNTDTVPIEKLILPGTCLRIKHDRRCITSADLEAAGKKPQQGHALLIDTGRDRTKYFSRDAAQWMGKCGIALMGSNTRVYDRGFENPTGFFVDLFNAEISIIANITNINMLPDDGFTLIVMPLKITGVCTVPCRVMAI
jgi:kynurenine formamidase